MSTVSENLQPVVEDEITIEVTVNGSPRSGRAEPRLLLADFLRQQLGLTGTHLGCEHGVCGACTVLIDGEPVRSCLMFAIQARGADITTVEGLDDDGELHPVQQAFHAKHGLQCGFCTPGMVLTCKALLDRNPTPSEREIRDFLSGNICRCTGYVGIVESVKEAAAAGRGAAEATSASTTTER
ncbi:(2Fe-2S)-binding protein [Pseudonocardia sp. H11422]|uniref:(2Fe-2S)-binding protein n=1 Tax=Pseudonocardia sp. H11422 TaxID=2835866 RepID=UPI001BDDBA19|nr:(2Fe-2S)-binding protein [Pseudonocardia sp. H11422]